MFCIGSSFVPSASLAFWFLCAAFGLCGFVFSSLYVNPLDIAPQYAAIIASFTNTVGAVPGFVIPVLVESITAERVSDLWNIFKFQGTAVMIQQTKCSSRNMRPQKSQSMGWIGIILAGAHY